MTMPLRVRSNTGLGRCLHASAGGAPQADVTVKNSCLHPLTLRVTVL